MEALTRVSVADLKAARIWSSFDHLVDGFSIRFGAWAQRILTKEARQAGEGFVAGGEAGALASITPGPWLAFLAKLWITVTTAGGQFTAEDLEPAEEIPDSVYENAARDWLDGNAKSHAIGITSTTHETTQQSIRNARDTGVTGSQGIAAMLTADLRRQAPGRAKRIANTEVHESANMGSYTAAKEVDAVGYKIWIATPDNRTRDAHMAAHNQRVRLTEPFIVGGERLMYPGHTSMGASLWNLVNCRCSQRFVMQRRAR
jgi:hypothetical protein